jgi:hypothetical protein
MGADFVAGLRPAITSLCEKASGIAGTESLITQALRTERPALLAPASVRGKSVEPD